MNRIKQIALYGALAAVVGLMLMGFSYTRNTEIYKLQQSDWTTAAGFNGTSPDSLLQAGTDTSVPFSVAGLKNIHVFVSANCDSSTFTIQHSVDKTNWTAAAACVRDTTEIVTQLDGVRGTTPVLLYMSIDQLAGVGAGSTDTVISIYPWIRFVWANEPAHKGVTVGGADTLLSPLVYIIGEKR